MKQIYVIGPAGGPYKIGVSKNPENRLAELQTGNHQQLRLELCYEADDADHEELRMHHALSDFRLHGEWFDCSLAAIHNKAGVAPPVYEKQYMTAADVEHWLLKMRNTSPFYNESQCAELLGCDIGYLVIFKAAGGSKTLALACAAVFHRLEPFKM